MLNLYVKTILDTGHWASHLELITEIMGAWAKTNCEPTKVLEKYVHVTELGEYKYTTVTTAHLTWFSATGFYY